MTRTQILERLKGAGLDVDGAVARLDGDISLYFQIVRRFTKDDVTQMARIRELLDAGSVPEARILAHTLRGSAANIGAKALSDSFRTLENQLVSVLETEGTPDPGTLEKTEILFEEMKGRLEDMNFSDPEFEAPLSTFSLSEDEWIQQLSTLREYIDLQQPRESLELLALLASSGPDDNLYTALKEIETSVRDYSFDKALETISGVLEEKRLL